MSKVEECRAVLARYGYPTSPAERLLADGIGPIELAARACRRDAGVGSLTYTHGLPLPRPITREDAVDGP